MHFPPPVHKGLFHNIVNMNPLNNTKKNPIFFNKRKDKKMSFASESLLFKKAANLISPSKKETKLCEVEISLQVSD